MKIGSLNDCRHFATDRSISIEFIHLHSAWTSSLHSFIDCNLHTNSSHTVHSQFIPRSLRRDALIDKACATMDEFLIPPGTHGCGCGHLWC